MGVEEIRIERREEKREKRQETRNLRIKGINNKRLIAYCPKRTANCELRIASGKQFKTPPPNPLIFWHRRFRFFYQKL